MELLLRAMAAYLRHGAGARHNSSSIVALRDLAGGQWSSVNVLDIAEQSTRDCGLKRFKAH